VLRAALDAPVSLEVEVPEVALSAS
jgi:hypothetical protein